MAVVAPDRVQGRAVAAGDWRFLLHRRHFGGLAASVTAKSAADCRRDLHHAAADLPRRAAVASHSAPARRAWALLAVLPIFLHRPVLQFLSVGWRGRRFPARLARLQ